MIALLVALFACGGEGDRSPVPAAAAAPKAEAKKGATKKAEEHAFLSPPDKSTVTVEQIPLAAWMPREWLERGPTLTLDGKRLDDPLAIARKRWSRGGGADYLSTLDLTALKPGPHTLELSVPAHQKQAAAHISSTFTYAPAPCRLTIRLEDGQGALRPGRLLVFDATSRAPVPIWGPGAAKDPSERDIAGNTLLLAEGEGSLRLPAGTYAFVAAGGLRDDVDQEVVTVKGDATLRFALPRVAPTPGALTADLHVHTGRSTDAWLPDRYRFDALVAAGLDVVVISDHNKVTDGGPPLKLLELEAALTVVPGVEARVGKALAGPAPALAEEDEEDEADEEGEAPAKAGERRSKSVSHINAFPLVSEAAGALPPTTTDSLARTLQAWRQRQVAHPYPGVGDRLLLQLNHPRGIQFQPTDKIARVHDLFDKVDYRGGLAMADQPRSWLTEAGGNPLDFDAIEVMNRFSARAWWEVRADWFSLLNQGIVMTATGNSDSHSVHVEQVGFPVNVVTMPAGPFSMAAFVDAIEAGRVMVSNGPLIEVKVTNARGEAAAPGDRLPTGGEAVVVDVHVWGAPWVPIPELRLILDGQPVARLDIGPDAIPTGGAPVPVERGHWRFSVPVKADGWLIAEAGWPIHRWRETVGGTYGLLTPGSVPVGFTNPVFLDADGDGAWTRPTATATLLSPP